MEKTEQLFKERIQIFKDVITFKKPSRIPILSNAMGTKVYEAGYKLSEGLYDYEIYKDCMRKYQEKYNCDTYMDVGFRNPMRVIRELGGTDYFIDDEINGINHSDICHSKPEDYALIKEDLVKYIYEVFIPGKYEGITKEKLIKGLKEHAMFGNYLQEINKIMKDEYGVPPLFSTIPALNPFEFIANGMRGIAGASLDMRRRRGELKEVLDIIFSNFNNIQVMSHQPDGTSQEAVTDTAAIMISHNFLNNKQFEELYWPYLKKIEQYCADHGKLMYIYAEGKNERLFEFFQEFNKGTVVVQIEMDDIFEAKKKIGNNVCLSGGFSHALLTTGTPDECRDYSKRLIEELGAEDGGYIFTTDKVLAFKADVNEENLKAAHETVRNYKLGRRAYV